MAPARTTISYDTLDRLTALIRISATNPSYDDVSNRIASHQGSSYSYQAFNRLVAANGTFRYDINDYQVKRWYAHPQTVEVQKRKDAGAKTGGSNSLRRVQRQLP